MSEVKNPTEQHAEGQEPRAGGGISAAGRKAGGQNRGTIKAGELREKLLRTGETPLEVLVDGMRQARKRHAKIETKLDAFDLETLPDPEAVKELTALMRAATGYLSEARECAKDAAPYLHPKLEPMGRFLELKLPTIKGAEDIMTAQAAIMEALASGDITPDEAAKVSGILESRRRSIETVEFEKRLQAIEAGRA
jgi:hypothetical protein